MIDGATLGQLLGPHEVLDTRLAKPIYDYFSDATDPPTTNGLLATLQEISGQSDTIVKLDALSGGYDAVSDEIRFAVDLEATRTGQVRLNAGSLTDDLEIQFAEGAEAD